MGCVHIILPSLSPSSFYVVAENVRSYEPSVTVGLSYRLGCVNVRVDDAKATVEYGRVCDVAWIDTWLVVERVSSRVRSRPAKIYVTSRFNHEMLSRLGVRVGGVVPRCVNKLAWSIPEVEKKYDFIVIGKSEETDRKALRVAEEVIARLRASSVWITDYKPRLERCVHHSVFSLPEREKLALIKQSRYLLWLSRAEGFGLPVLEAMALGVPVVYSDAPAHNEFAVGYRVPVRERVRVQTRYGAAVYHYVSSIEALEVASNALAASSREYKELSEQAKEKAAKLHSTFESWLKTITQTTIPAK